MLDNFFKLFTDEYFAIFALFVNFFILLILTLLFFETRNSRKRWNKVTDYLGDVTKTVNSVRYGDLTKKINKLDIIDSEDLTESLNRMIETLKDREIMIDEFQKDLIKQNRILEQTVNSLSDGLLITNDSGEIYRASEVIVSWFKVEGKALLGKSIYDFIQIPKGKTIQSLNNDEIFIPTKKNSKFVVNSVELNLDDKKERYVVIIKNITMQKELETLREDFVATLTHDLKVPIIAETNMIDLFLNENFGPISEKQMLALKNMQASNKELLELVQIVLDTYRIGKITLYKENFMLINFIKEIEKEMIPLINKNGNTFVFNPERDIRILADKVQLKRIIKNLIQNAILYGEAKTPIEISIGEIPQFVTIKVKDYGAGISKEDIDKIFDKYYSASKKFKKIGTGLGLYLSNQLARAHDGELTVDSVKGEYTEFCIKIPVKYYERNFM